MSHLFFFILLPVYTQAFVALFSLHPVLVFFSVHLIYSLASLVSLFLLFFLFILCLPRLPLLPLSWLVVWFTARPHIQSSPFFLISIIVILALTIVLHFLSASSLSPSCTGYDDLRLFIFIFSCFFPFPCFSLTVISKTIASFVVLQHSWLRLSATMYAVCCRCLRCVVNCVTCCCRCCCYPKPLPQPQHYSCHYDWERVVALFISPARSNSRCVDFYSIITLLSDYFAFSRKDTLFFLPFRAYLSTYALYLSRVLLL